MASGILILCKASHKMLHFYKKLWGLVLEPQGVGMLKK